MRLIFAAGIFSILLLVSSASLHAQAEVIDQEPISSGVTYEQLRQDYFFQLEHYRTAERRFNLDRAEFNQLQTLQSREKAVESMRPYLEARARVLFTYLVALEFLLREAQGVDVVAKEQTLAILVTGKNYMINFIDEVPSLTDRESVNQASESFEADGRALAEEGQFRTLTLLAIGRVSRSYDQLNFATIDFRNDYIENIGNDSLKARIERGMRDVDFQNERANEAILQSVEQFPPRQTEEMKSEPRYRPPNYNQIYSQTVSRLETAYGAMRQSIRFLKELERQI